MKLQAFLRVAALSGAALGAATLGAAEPPPPAAASSTARTLEPDAAVASGRGGVDAELGTLDGGALTRSLERAAREGRRLRLLLDPYDKDSRRQSALLEGISPSVQVRWQEGLGFKGRSLNVEDVGRLLWRVGQRPVLSLGPEAGQGFEKDWARAQRGLPKALRLRDQLEALPDPREHSPHYVRRINGGVP